MSGPTHGSAPTNSIETSLNPGRSGRGQSPAPTGLSWCAAAGRCTEGMASADQISCRNLGRRSWASAPTGRRASHINHPGQRRRAFAPAVTRGGWDMRQRSSQSVQQPRAIPQSRHSRDSSLCTREPFPAEGGEAGGHIGPPLRGHRNS